MATIEELSRDLSLFRNNPMGMYQEVINLVERNSNGETQVLSATTPFALSLEMMTALGTAAMSLHDTNIRKQFKSLSQNQSELYRHMADRDFINVYSKIVFLPQETTIFTIGRFTQTNPYSSACEREIVVIYR